MSSSVGGFKLSQVANMDQTPLPVVSGFGGVVNFALIIKRILGIKRIFPCSFGNKRMRLLTRVYGKRGNRLHCVPIHK